MAEFASKGWASLNTVLGSIGTAGTTGVLGNLFGGMGGNGCHENTPVNRYELGLEQTIAGLKSDVALRDAYIESNQRFLEFYKFFDGKIEGINQRLSDQAVWNATQTSTISCMASQIAQLYGLTKLVVPNTSVCPGWGNVTVTPATTTTGA